MVYYRNWSEDQCVSMEHEKLLEMPDGTILGRSGEYIEIGGTRFYYEMHGRGTPVLLMHGAWTSVESLMCQVGPISERFQVILVERRGHGRTPDTPGKFTYMQGARDMISILDGLGLERVDVVGWSDGAVIGLLMAREFPDRVRRLVSISGCYHPRGYTREFAREFEEGAVENVDPVISRVYGWVSPDGADHFPVVFEKVKAMLSSHPRMTKRDLANIETPIMVMSGDEDIVSLEHSVNLYKGLRNGFLSIVPGSTHMLPLERSDLVNEQILQFLCQRELSRHDDGLFRS
jgi:pimeloyl-ACP methyl ester carboxylesterase